MKLYSGRNVLVLGVALALFALGGGALLATLFIVPRVVAGQVAALPVAPAPSADLTPIQFRSTAPAQGAGGLLDDEINNIADLRP